MRSSVEEQFIAWLTTQTNANGTLFLERVARRYASNIRSAPSKLNLTLTVEERNVFNCQKLTDFDQMRQAFVNAPNYYKINHESDHGAFSAGLTAYRRYLEYLKGRERNETNNTEFRKSDDDSPLTTNEKPIDSFITLPNGERFPIDDIIDLDEAQTEMDKILCTHFAQLHGYSNKRLLYEAAKITLPMFLNDNGFNDEGTVFTVAKYLLGNRYIFYDLHIWQTNPQYPMSNIGLLINFGRINGGVFSKGEAEQYLQKIKIQTNLTNIIRQNNNNREFFLYDADRIILAEALDLTQERTDNIFNEIYKLFKCENVEYIIPRDISVEWFACLPPISEGYEWKPLLLQEVIGQYPERGIKVIKSGLQKQDIFTLAVAFVTEASMLNTFADVVHLYLSHNRKLPECMLVEDLRLILRNTGMIAGNELVYNLYKVLGRDHRFAFVDNNQTVKILER